MERLKKILLNIEDNISALMLAIMLVVLFQQVLSRWAGASNSWSEELSRYFFVWIVYLGGSSAVKTNEHVKIEALTKLWPKKIRPFALLIGDIMWLVFACFIIYYSGKLTYNLFKVGTVSMGLRINMGWAYAAIPVGYTLMCWRVLSCLVIPGVKNIIAIFKHERIDESSSQEKSLKEGDQ